MTALPSAQTLKQVDSATLEKRAKLNEQHAQLKSERSSWDAHVRELCEQFMPRRKRFFVGDEDGRKKQSSLINGTPLWALGVLEAGMMAGITSPSRRWFKLITRRPMDEKSEAVSEYFYELEGILEDLLANSNLYKCLPQVYADIGAIGTTVLWVEEDTEDVIRGEVFPPGQYALANGPDGKVDTVFREFPLTARQLVKKFGADKCSQAVQLAADPKLGNQPFQKFTVVHAVYPNPDFDEGALGPRGKKWASCWWEAAGDVTQGFLAEEGYFTCPFACPRWKTHGQDVYGSSPGMEALGDARALQLLEKRSLELTEKLARPTMVGPATMANSALSMSPGGMNFVEALGQGQDFKPAFQIDPRAVPAVGEQIQGHMQRINRAFHADLFLMLSLYDKQQKTATEVNELREEKMLQLGPVVESVFDELLDVLLERVFDVAFRRGLLPPAPQELQGDDVRPQYLSILSQAQKLRGTTAVVQLMGFVTSLAQMKPDALDKVDTDEATEAMGDMLGVAPNIVRSDDKVQELRDARAKVQAEQEQRQKAAAMVQGAQTLSQTDTSGDNALTRMLGGMGAPNVPGVG